MAKSPPTPPTIPEEEQPADESLIWHRRQTEFGAAVRAARQLLGIHQNDLATRAGVAVLALAELERGTVRARGASLSTVDAIYRALDSLGVVLVLPGRGGDGSALDARGAGARLKT